MPWKHLHNSSKKINSSQTQNAFNSWGSSDLEHASIYVLRRNSPEQHSLLSLRRRQSSPWGFYRQYIPYLVVLFQSIYQVIKNIFCFEWVQEQAEASSWSKLQCKQPCHLAPNSAESRPLEICGRWGCSLESGTTLMGKAHFLGFMHKNSLRSLQSNYYFEKYSCLTLYFGWCLSMCPCKLR